MDTFTIYTLGGGDILWSVFNALSMLLNPHSSGGIFKTFVAIGTSVGATMSVWFLVFKNQVDQTMKWFLTTTILVTGLLLPISRVVIHDFQGGAPRTVDHIPFILAFGASVTSSLGNGLTHKIEQAFQPSPTEMIGGVGITGNPPSSYSQTGFIFGAEVLKGMKSIALTNEDIEQNMHGFVNQCITYDAMIGRKYTLHDLKHSSDLWGLVSKKASKLRGFPWRNVTRTGTDISSSHTEIITCHEGVRRLNNHWNEMANSSLEDLLKKIGIQQTWRKKDPTQDDHIKKYLPGALDRLTGSAKSALDHIKQQMMISSILKGSQQKAVELGGAKDFAVHRAYFQAQENYKTVGHMIASALPSIKNVLEALLYCLFIFVILMVFLPDGTKMLWFYFKILLWLQLWAPLFAMLNFIMTEVMSWKAISSLKGADGITIGNFVGLTNMANDMASIAGYLCSMIPILSWVILEKGGYAFVSMTSSLLGVAQSSATQSAVEKVSGNYSFANTSFDNEQMGNRSYLKQDMAPSYTSGFIATNDGAGSLLTTARGEQIIIQNESHLPVSLNMAQTQENSLRNAQREAYSFAESEQQALTLSKQHAQNHYLEIGKQASQMFSQGVQIGDQQQAQVLREAAHHYNKVEDISNRTGLNKEYVNQKILEFGVGIEGESKFGGSIGKGVSPFSFSAELSGKMNKTEQSNMSAHQAAEEIITLGKQTQFNETHQRMDNAFKNRSFDINNQELKQSTNNFSSSFEEAKRHEMSASKAFEKARSLDQEIAFTQSNAATINASHNQEFVNHVGAEEIRKMDLKTQQQKAFNYMQNQLLLEERFPRRQSSTPQHLKESYHSSTQDHNHTTIDQIKQDHQAFEKDIYQPQKQKGVQKNETADLEHAVDDKMIAVQKKSMDAQMQATLQQVNAHQTFDLDHQKHAQDNMGWTQEGVTKEMLQNHKGKKGHD